MSFLDDIAALPSGLANVNDSMSSGDTLRAGLDKAGDLNLSIAGFIQTFTARSGGMAPASGQFRSFALLARLLMGA